MPERQVGGQCLITQRADFLMTPLCLARPCSMIARRALRSEQDGRLPRPLFDQGIVPVAGVYTCRHRSKGTRSPRANDSALPDGVSRVTRVRGSCRGEPFSSSSTRRERACAACTWSSRHVGVVPTLFCNALTCYTFFLWMDIFPLASLDRREGRCGERMWGAKCALNLVAERTKMGLFD